MTKTYEKRDDRQDDSGSHRSRDSERWSPPPVVVLAGGSEFEAPASLNSASRGPWQFWRRTSLEDGPCTADAHS